MTPLSKLLLHISFCLVFISGSAFAVMKYLMVSEDPYSAVGHPLQPWALSTHVIAAPVAVFAFGLIFRDHILRKIRGENGRADAGPPADRSAGRVSGLLSLGFFLPMVASGTLLQTVTNETLREVTAIVHLATGGLYGAFYLAHVARAWLGGRQEARPRAAGAPR